MAPVNDNGKAWRATHTGGASFVLTDDEAMSHLCKCDTNSATIDYADYSFVIGDWKFTPMHVVEEFEIVRAMGWLWKAA